MPLGYFCVIFRAHPVPEMEGNFMDASRPLFIPVILGTARMGRMSLHAARLVTREVGKRAGVVAAPPYPQNSAVGGGREGEPNKAPLIRAEGEGGPLLGTGEKGLKND